MVSRRSGLPENTWTLPDGTQVRCVNREQLRFTLHGRTFGIPQHLDGLMDVIPTPPAIFDHSKNGAIKYPILGNNRKGDCFYVACEHASQTFTGNSGTECDFDEARTIARYLVISGGDNGLDDATMIPEWKQGVIGPSGPRRVLSVMTIDPRNQKNMALGLWAFGGSLWTASLADVWIQTAQPGAVWGVAVPNPRNGHAMHLTGINSRGNFDVQTWALGPPFVEVTPQGLLSCHPEILVAYSTDQFNAQGICAFTGMTWDQKNRLWQVLGGKDQGPSPFPAPSPIPPIPIPPIPTPGTATFFLPQALAAGTYLLTKTKEPSNGVDPMPLLHEFTFSIEDVQNALSPATPLPQRINSVIWLAGFAAQERIKGFATMPQTGQLTPTADQGKAELERMLRLGVGQFGASSIDWQAVGVYLAQLLVQLALQGIQGA